MSGKCTIDDIARLAKVSKATVSRVLNHKPDVDPVTRERVLGIINEQGYVPSLTASGLAGRNRLIGMLVPSFTWPFVGDIIRGAAEIIGQTLYELVLYSINDSIRDQNKTNTISRILATKLTAGLLAVYPGPSAQHLSRLHHHEFPVVVIDDQYYSTRAPWTKDDTSWVGADNYLGAKMAVQHLLQLGHRRIAHVRGPMRYQCSRERYEGYCQALREAGSTPDPELVQEGDLIVEGGLAAARRLFELPAERRPSAIFAASDLMAYGVMEAAEAHGLSIPGDVALVGFDDIPSSAHIRPALTTVRQPFYEMGQQGMRLLLSQIETVHAGGPQTNGLRDTAPGTPPHALPEEIPFAQSERAGVALYIPISLIVRTSCGSPHPWTEMVPSEYR